MKVYMKNKCLYCYLELTENEIDFHGKCSKKIFGHSIAPILPYHENEMTKLAEKVIQTQTTITGAQSKLSLHLASDKGANALKRFTIVGLWGEYILKPPTDYYPQLPEVEDVTMHLATIAKIKVVPHSLIRMSSGNLAYITKRIDRQKNAKLPMEDMCQLTERITEDKYNSSYEQIAKCIQKHSTNPGLDIINFFEILIFSFITGNADMHLKNFSLIENSGVGSTLSPAYDLVATAIINPEDGEDLALTLNGKKKKINMTDFVSAANSAKISPKQLENIFEKMQKAKADWHQFIDKSFLSKTYQKKYKALIENRFNRLK